MNLKLGCQSPLILKLDWHCVLMNFENNLPMIQWESNQEPYNKVKAGILGNNFDTSGSGLAHKNFRMRPCKLLCQNDWIGSRWYSGLNKITGSVHLSPLVISARRFTPTAAIRALCEVDNRGGWKDLGWEEHRPELDHHRAHLPCGQWNIAIGVCRDRSGRHVVACFTILSWSWQAIGYHPWTISFSRAPRWAGHRRNILAAVNSIPIQNSW
jgi:hypothetical protein